MKGSRLQLENTYIDALRDLQGSGVFLQLTNGSLFELVILSLKVEENS